MLGESKSGFYRAVEWFYSIDPELRKNAILVFHDIGDEESIKYLEIATKDIDDWVSQYAKRSLEKMKQKEKEKPDKENKGNK